jgi:hypothetical protein
MKKRTSYKIVFSAVLSMLIHSHLWAGTSANLNQARNGTDPLPTNPVSWVNGNLNGSQAHYKEAMSSPFQCVMINLTPGLQVDLVIGYDIKNSSQHAYDYLTHYNRITPHDFPSHSTAETIDILAGSGLPSNTPYTTYTIPTPSTAGSPVSGQPALSYNALTIAERQMTLFNGTIDTIFYVVQGDLNANQSETQINIRFTPSSVTAVLAWGGHIASRNDWGYVSGSPRSAGGISGSPFHMRLITWTYGSTGNQDRSLSGGSVSAPPLPLPVEMMRFEVHQVGSANSVEWSTASEINCDHFSVERSKDAVDFQRLAVLPGAGNSSMVHNYAWTDESPLPGISYYRLIQTDFDGAGHVYGPVSTRQDTRGSGSFKLITEENSGQTYVSFHAYAAGNATLEVMNLEGKRVSTESIQTARGENFVKVNSLPAHPGLYFLLLRQSDASSGVQKVLVH